MRPALLLLLLAGCDSREMFASPTPGWQRMLRQSKVNAYEESERLPNRGRPPEGTIAREDLDDVARPAWTAATLARGAERFDIMCSPCHGATGHADTHVADVMELRRPADLHEDRVRALADAMILQVIREGYGLMPSYADRLSVPDAWAVVGHVRALQLAEHAPLAELPAWAQARARTELP